MSTTMTAHPSSLAHATSGENRARWARALKWLAAALVIAVAAWGALRYSRSKPASPVHYETAPIDRGTIVAKVTATGTVSALVTVSVGSQVSGRIERLFADFGSQVRRGQTIATIEPSLFRASVAQARANRAAAAAAVDSAHSHVVLAEKAFARARDLLAANLLSRADYDTAEATLAAARADEAAASSAVKQADAAAQQAELNLKYTTIVSPIDGIVISRNVDVGQTVAAALQAPTLFTIAQDLTRMQVDTNVAEADVGKVRAGMNVTFTVDAYPNRVFSGVVRQVRDNATTLQNVVTYDAVIDVDNTERLLKPGMTASVAFTYATRDDVLRVSNAALRFRPDSAVMKAMAAPAPPTSKASEHAVWVLRGGRPVVVVVEVGISDGASTEVLSGDLRPDDKAIVEATLASAKGGP